MKKSLETNKVYFILLITTLLSCSSYSLENEIIGEYKALPSDELSIGFDAFKGGITEMGDFGKFASVLTEVLANEIDIRFYFEENNKGKYIMQNNGFLSQLTNKVEKQETKFKYIIEYDTALFFYGNNLEEKQRVGTIVLDEYKEIDYIKIKLNKDDYGFLFMKLTEKLL